MNKTQEMGTTKVSVLHQQKVFHRTLCNSWTLEMVNVWKKKVRAECWALTPCQNFSLYYPVSHYLLSQHPIFTLGIQWPMTHSLPSVLDLSPAPGKGTCSWDLDRWMAHDRRGAKLWDLFWQRSGTAGTHSLDCCNLHCREKACVRMKPTQKRKSKPGAASFFHYTCLNWISVLPPICSQAFISPVLLKFISSAIFAM